MYAMPLSCDLEKELKSTSRTFYIPITRMKGRLRTAVAATYLAFRAIDEIEDHPVIPVDERAFILENISMALIGTVSRRNLEVNKVISPWMELLPPVTRRLTYWLDSLPGEIAPGVVNSVSTMSARMSNWCTRHWKIHSIFDLDQYTYSVAGAVGLKLAELFQWGANASSDQALSVQFGRGLQAVNIILNRDEDIEAGRDFFPTDWEADEMKRYAHACLKEGVQFQECFTDTRLNEFCRIPLDLAKASLEVFYSHKRKLTRSEVNLICGAED